MAILQISKLCSFLHCLCTTRFATAAVLGGAIFILIPIYQAYLDFSDEMVAILFALNMILDPIVTSSNVMANGGLARVFEIVWSKVSPNQEKTVAASNSYR
jgi:Na+/H+-dicarboxylate symporter